MNREMADYTEGDIGNFRIIEDFLPPPEELIRRQDVQARFVIYRDRVSHWRWTLQDSDGRRLADSAEGYNDRHDCLQAIELLRAAVKAPVSEAT